jgi:hypothetical protein
MTVLNNSSFKVKAGRVADLADIQPEAGAIVINDTDGELYIASDLGWIKFSPSSPFAIFYQYDGVTQFAAWMRLPIGQTLNVDWGDGTNTDYPGNDATIVNLLSSYTTPGSYLITFGGDVLGLTSLNITDMPLLSGSLNGLKDLTNLDYLAISGTNLVGDLKYLNALTSTEMYFINMPFLEGDAAELAGTLENVQIENCPRTSFSQVQPYAARDTKTIIFQNNGWSSDEVDNAIKSLELITNSRLILTGNENRSVGSNASLQAIIANGNTLACNETDRLTDLGPELFTTACAVSDPNGNEIDGVAGFLATGLGSPNEFESQTLRKTKGVYGIKANANPVPTANARFEVSPDFVVVSGQPYRVAFDVRHLGQGERWEPRLDGAASGLYINPTDTEFQSIAWYKEAVAATLGFQMRERSPTGKNGGVYFDNLSARLVNF